MEKIGDFNMHCGECDVIDYCNDYEDTPPCAQPRFKEVGVNTFLEIVETCSGEVNDLLEEVYLKLKAKGFYNY